MQCVITLWDSLPQGSTDTGGLAGYTFTHNKKIICRKKNHLGRPYLQDIQALSTGLVWKAPRLRGPPGLPLSRLRGGDEPCEGRQGGGHGGSAGAVTSRFRDGGQA